MIVLCLETFKRQVGYMGGMEGARAVSLRALIALAVALAVAAFVAGFAAGYGMRDGEVNALQRRLEELTNEFRSIDAERRSLEQQSSMLEARLGEVTRLLEQARAEIAEKESQLSSLVESYKSRAEQAEANYEKLSEIVKKMESNAARLEKAVPILNQLKEVNNIPTDRDGALNYWSDIKSAVIEFDQSLTPEVDRIINNVDGWVAYNEWLRSAPPAGASLQEVVRWFLSYPENSNLYFEAVDNFIDELTTSIAARIMSIRG